MTLALVEVYRQRRRHLDAYDIAETLVPLLMNTVRWLPDMEREDTLLQRLFLAEKWLVTKLHYAHTDPREAGVGNMVNCGAAMYMAPVGVANAGDPEGAYAEAIEIAGAHQSSYGREAAGVFAAAVAAAMAPGATASDVAGGKFLHFTRIERTSRSGGSHNRGHQVREHIEPLSSRFQSGRRLDVIRRSHVDAEPDRYPLDRLLAPPSLDKYATQLSSIDVEIVRPL